MFRCQTPQIFKTCNKKCNMYHSCVNVFTISIFNRLLPYPWYVIKNSGRSRAQRDPILSFSRTFPPKSSRIQREILDPQLKNLVCRIIKNLRKSPVERLYKSDGKLHWRVDRHHPALSSSYSVYSPKSTQRITHTKFVFDANGHMCWASFIYLS